LSCNITAYIPDFDENKPVNVNCKCETTFCSNCRRDAHSPLSCSQTATWDEIKENYNESMVGSSYMTNTYKKCPFCGIPVGNEGTENNVRCECGDIFCFQCLGNIHSGDCVDKAMKLQQNKWVTFENCNASYEAAHTS